MALIRVMEYKGTREQTKCLEFMFSQIEDSMSPENFEKFKEAVYMREDTASTYVGDELAVPHGRVDGLSAEYITVCLCKGGVDWPSEDCTAKIVVLIGVDKSKISTYLAVLQKIIKWKKNAGADVDSLTTESVLASFEDMLG